MRRGIYSRVGAVIAAGTLMLGLAACGGDEKPAASGNGKDGGVEVSDLTVGIVPVIDHAAVFVAKDKGFFSEEGLNVTPQPMQGGAAAVPAMMSGDLQAAFATYPSFLLAQSQGLGVKIVAEGVRATETTGGVYVWKNSPLKEAADLKGKTIAVNTLNNTGDVTIKAVLKEKGVDPSSVEFIELPFPDMAGALERGSVDAAWVVEPFRTGLAAAGARQVLASYSGVAAGIPVSGLAMSEKFVNENPNTAAAFARAIEKANALIADDPDITREAVTGYSKSTPEQAKAMELPQWVKGAPDENELSRWNDLMVDTGAMKDAVDLKAMVLEK